ncbi:hypothetical protein A3K73_04720 [Candidatus Pacearchaeota archaeon RBG_13_36_9]|nr:MAG: hypothetical protein A3K73_04720 [Candidatus Pacearchaeota archaeon RBG_13_36_9]
MGKKDLGEKVKDNKSRLRKISLEGSEVIAENKRRYMQLSFWMRKHFDEIFANAPNKEPYAVGVWKEKKPEVHYFRDYWNEALQFIGRCAKEGETNTYLIDRNQKNRELMLAVG